MYFQVPQTDLTVLLEPFFHVIANSHIKVVKTRVLERVFVPLMQEAQSNEETPEGALTNHIDLVQVAKRLFDYASNRFVCLLARLDPSVNNYIFIYLFVGTLWRIIARQSGNFDLVSRWF